MTYASIVEMTRSEALIQRIAAAAAEEGFSEEPADLWAKRNIWQIVAQGNWDAAWDSAKANPSVNFNPDTGARDDVITDGMILAVVQPMVNPPEPLTEPPPVMDNTLPEPETGS